MAEKGGSPSELTKRSSLFSCHRTSSPSSHADDASIATNQHAPRLTKPSIRERRGACTMGLRTSGKNTACRLSAREVQTKGEPWGNEHRLPSTKKENQ